MSLRDKIAAIEDIPFEDVEVPEWGVTIRVIGMNAGDRGELLAGSINEDGRPDLKNMYPDVVVLTAHDPETGERIWDEEHRAMLMAKSGKAVDRLATAGMRLSGMDPDAREAAGKGSSSTPTDASSSN